MIPIDPATLRKIVATARLLDSDQPGEAAAAARALKRLTPGVSIADLLEGAFKSAPSPVVAVPAGRSVWDIRTDPVCSWRNTARSVLADKKQLSERELEFVLAMAGRRECPTPKQRQWLDDLAAREASRWAA